MTAVGPRPEPIAGRDAVAWRLFQAALFTLPWVGLGVAALVTGRDLGAGFQLSWLLLALAVTLIGPDLYRFLRRWRRTWLIAVGPFLVALLVSVLGLWLSPAGEALAVSLLRYAKQILQIGIMFFFVLVPAYYLARGFPMARIVRPLLWGAVWQAVYAFLQAVDFWLPLEWFAALEEVFTSNPAILAGSEQLYLGNVIQEIPRLRGTVCEPLYLGNFLLFAIPLVFLAGWTRLKSAVIGAVLLGLLLLTWSRGAWLAGVGSVSIGLVLARQYELVSVGAFLRHRKTWLVMGGLAIVVVVLAAGRAEFWLPWRRLMQSFSMVDWSNLTRLYSMEAAWRGFLLSPVVGLGWGQFGFHFAALADPMGLQSMFTWPVVNNFPLQILCECGVLGALAFFWAWWRLMAPCLRRLRAKGSLSFSILILSVSVVGTWLQMLTFSQYNLPHIWVGLGLLVGCLAAPTAATNSEAR